MKSDKGLSMKDVRTEEDGVYPVRMRGFFRFRRPQVLIQSLDFSKFMVCPYGQGGGGWASADKGRGQVFVILCGRLLWTAP